MVRWNRSVRRRCRPALISRCGTYQQVRLILAPNVDGAATLNNSVVPSGQTTEVALKTPSAVQTGIKVNTRAPFTVEPGTLVDLVLDFNACKSVVTKIGRAHV